MLFVSMCSVVDWQIVGKSGDIKLGTELCEVNKNDGIWREYEKNQVSFQVNEGWEGNLDNISVKEEKKDEVKLSLYGFRSYKWNPLKTHVCGSTFLGESCT